MKFLGLKLVSTLMLLLGIGLYWIVATPAGTAFAIQQISKGCHACFTVGSIQGRLWDDVKLQDVHMVTQAFEFHSEALAIEWNPVFLLKKTFWIHNLTLNKTQLLLKSSGSHQNGATLPEWFFHITHFDLQTLKIEKDQQVVVDLNTLHGDMTLEASHVAIQTQMDLKAPIQLKSELKVTGSLQNYQWWLSAQHQAESWSAAGRGSDKTLSLLKTNGALFGHTLEAQGEIDKGLNWRLSAQLRGKGWHTDSVRSVTPFVLNVEGRRQGDTTHVRLDTGASKVAISALGIVLDQSKLQLDMAKGVGIYTGLLGSKGQQLQLSGKAYSNQHQWFVQTHLKSDRFLVSDLAEARIYAGFTLQLNYQTQKGLEVTGKVALSDTDIRLKPEGVISLPAETQIVQANGKISSHNPLKIPIRSNVQVRLEKNKVHLQVSGLESLLNGAINVQNDPSTGVLATGRLNLNKGSYELQGQHLKLRNSFIEFNHTLLTNPYLNIQAIKTLQYTEANTFAQDNRQVVGIQVTGTAENPRIVLFAEPANWSESDILSLILLGQPANRASGSGLALLSLAAQNLGAKNGWGMTQFTDQLKQFLGFDEFGLQSGLTSDEDINAVQKTTSFVLGKYLSPRLYLNYSMNLTEGVNTLKLRYLIAKRWWIQTQTNVLGSAVDVLYLY